MFQNTQEWLSWRTKGIGASDSPILLGLSKRTPYELWLEKTGRAEQHGIPTFAKAKGGEIEAQLRARYSLDVGLQFEPACASHDEYPFLLASYDGVAYEDGKLRAIEIKFVGAEYYAQEQIKEAHRIQCQHQIMVMDLEYVDYLYSVDGVAYKRLRILPDYKAWSEIFTAAYIFNEYLVRDVAPPLTEQDWWPATEELDKLLLEGDRDQIKAAMTHPRVIGSKHKAQIDKRGALRLCEITSGR